MLLNALTVLLVGQAQALAPMAPTVGRYSSPRVSDQAQPASVFVDPFPASAPPSEPLFQNMVKRSFKFFVDQTLASGLTKDRASNIGPVDNYTVASVASSGFALAAFAIGADRGWMPRSTMLAKCDLVMDAINNLAPKEHGWLYHFLDVNTGQRVWNSEVSSIDTSICLAGALMAEREFKDSALTARVNQFLNGIDWQWMLTDGGAKPNSLTFCMGWTPENGFLPYRWDSYSELMILYIEALGASPSVPTATWAAWNRPVLWYQGLDMLSGGPMFMHYMSQGFLDMSGQRDSLGWDYWVDAYHDSLANRQYCINNPHGWVGYGPNTWGMTACDSPYGYEACGAPGWGVDDGTLSPAAACSMWPYTGANSFAAFTAYFNNYHGAYGRYGFSNAINPSAGWTDTDVIGIDLGMLIINVEDAVDHLPQRLSLANSVNATGMARAGFHFTNEGPLTSRALNVAP